MNTLDIIAQDPIAAIGGIAIIVFVLWWLFNQDLGDVLLLLTAVGFGWWLLN